MEGRSGVIGRAGYLGLFGNGSFKSLAFAKICASPPRVECPPVEVRLDNGILYPHLHPLPSSLASLPLSPTFSTPHLPSYRPSPLPSTASTQDHLSSHCTPCSYTLTVPWLPRVAHSNQLDPVVLFPCPNILLEPIPSSQPHIHIHQDDPTPPTLIFDLVQNFLPCTLPETRETSTSQISPFRSSDSFRFLIFSYWGFGSEVRKAILPR